MSAQQMAQNELGYVCFIRQLQSYPLVFDLIPVRLALKLDLNISSWE